MKKKEIMEKTVYFINPSRKQKVKDKAKKDKKTPSQIIREQLDLIK